MKVSSLTFVEKYAAVKQKNLRGKDWKEVVYHLNNRCIPEGGPYFEYKQLVGPDVGCADGIVGLGNVGVVVPGFVGIASPLQRSELDLSEGDDNLSDSKQQGTDGLPGGDASDLVDGGGIPFCSQSELDTSSPISKSRVAVG
ncbi:hypothetical protein R1sor_021156 [Riccia sorocarpa]|uniref:Uncharacterized protein n=1 Tax=Riccia sorocarpa TaxID=122646 RepID=A0ABD3GJE2_9MARC